MKIAALLFCVSCLVANVSAAEPVRVMLETSAGNIELTLDAEKAPVSTENFLRYVDDGFYDGTIFHRVIRGFMIQGGGLTADMNRKQTRDPIKNESANGLKNKRGTLAMARTNQPHSATAQFFVNLVDNAFLDRESARDNWGYAVFGRVSSGMDVVDRIAATTVSSQGRRRNVPTTPIILERARRITTSDSQTGEAQ